MEHGVYAYIKHFVLNDQETNRQSMLCTWCNEQALREIYMKPFEIAVKDGHAKAVMSAYNYLDTTWASATDALLNTFLRDEWGFRGFCLTDYFIGNGFMNSDQMIRNGNDAALVAYPMVYNLVADTQSATSLLAMRQAAKNQMHTVVNSRAYDENAVHSGLYSWQVILIVVDVILAALVIGLEVLIFRKYRSHNQETT